MKGLVNVCGGGGVGGYIINLHCDNRLIGQTITASQSGQTSMTAVVDSNGIAYFETDINGVWRFTEPLHSRYVDVDLEHYGVYNPELISYFIFGYQILSGESSPSNAVTYHVQYDGVNVDNYDYTSAGMDYSGGVFNYGSWENAFFMPKPCMLKYDGTVDYYLDEDDYTKKADGVSASDVADSSYGGNAMMEWGQNNDKIYYKVVPQNSGAQAIVYVSNIKLDNDFKCWSFYDSDNNEIDHFYTPIYNGANVSSKLRSISGLSILNNATAQTEVSYAVANNTVSSEVEWYTEVLADRILINILLVLMGKSLDTQTVFGNGHYTGGSSASNLLQTGTMNTRGLFWGTNGTGSGVKVFGMENYWGNQWRRTAGWMYVSNVQKIKLTHGTADGSTVASYNFDGSGYIALSNSSVGGTTGGYISAVTYNENGVFPKTASGSQSTYYCDGAWYANGTMYALVGGSCDGGFLVGAFYSDLTIASSGAGWGLGAALSCKPRLRG